MAIHLSVKRVSPGRADGDLNATERSTLIELHKRICCAFLLAGLLAFPKVSSPALPASRQAKAIATLDRAVRMRTTLESLPENKRTESDYHKVIETFQQVARLDPAYAKTPMALAGVAELYEEMGRLFSADRYYLKSVKTYQFLISEYPHSQVARDALFTLGEIYRTDLENPEDARQTFQKFLDKYPKSSKAEEAQAKIKEIDQLHAERAATQSAPWHGTAEGRRAHGLPEVTEVRRWVGPNYSRIVIGVDEEVKFESSRLSKPDRIVLDIESARLSPALVGKTFPVEDGFLHQIRLGQFTSTVTRVVLDVEKIEDYSVLPLPNPFRLVVDIHGGSTPSRETGRAAKEPTTRPATARTQRREESSSATEPPASSSEAAQIPEIATPSTKPKPEGEKTGKTRGSEQTQEVETASAKPPPTLPASGETGTSALETLPAKPAPVLAKAAAPTESGSRTLTRVLGLKIGRIAIDPGHGGHDTGTIGPTGLREKDIVLDVGLRLKKLLERKVGCEVVMTRSDDTFIPLEERTAIANEKAADLFVSIHANASRDRSARGIETYYLNFTSSPDALEVAARENATSQESVHQLQDLIQKIAMTEKIEESEEFARQLQKEVYRRTSQLSGKQRDRGVKKAPFVVLIGANMPSVLAEISFLTNPRDEKSLRRSDYRQKIAEALCQGILDYVNNLGGVKVVQRAASDRTASKTGAEF
jgi:N-acetylmuramoyl-L-alanine amidase